MKIHSVVALVGLAMSFVLPTFAQEKDTGVVGNRGQRVPSDALELPARGREIRLHSGERRGMVKHTHHNCSRQRIEIGRPD